VLACIAPIVLHPPEKAGKDLGGGKAYALGDAPRHPVSSELRSGAVQQRLRHSVGIEQNEIALAQAAVPGLILCLFEHSKNKPALG